MYGTKSLSLKEQVTEIKSEPALLVVAHGDRGGGGEDSLVHEIVSKLLERPRYRAVRACFVNKEPSLFEVFKDVCPGPVVILPLFMSDGYFVNKAIPKMLDLDSTTDRAGSAMVQILKPVGLNAKLPKLVADVAVSTAEQSKQLVKQFNLLLVAHGSKGDRASFQATTWLVESIEKTCDFASVHAAFLEETPFLDDQLRRIEGPLLVVGLFIGDGLHAGVDLPEAIQRSGRNDILLVPPLAQSLEFIEMICSQLNQDEV